MIIKTQENYPDRISLYIDYKGDSYLCETFKSKTGERSNVWFNISCKSDKVRSVAGFVDVQEKEELEKELKNYYRKKKLERL